MTNGIFCEPRPGIVAHTAASRLLVENCAVRDFVGVSVEEATPAHAKTINAISKWGYAKDCSQSVREIHDSCCHGQLIKVVGL